MATGRIDSSKPGIFQKISFTGTWLGRDHSDDVGLGELELYSVFAFPLPSRESPLVITPGFEVRYLNGPAGIAADLPPRIYDAYLQVRWMRQLGARWGVDVAVTPGVHTDFEDVDDEAIRITGRGLASFDWTENLKLVLGVAYLDREDIRFLPVGGLIWTPTDDVRWELVVPRPKIAYRLWCGDCTEHWGYVVGEFGGGSWSIERTGGAADVLTIRDYRVILGLQEKREGGSGWRIEAGWVFGREVEYASGAGDFQPDDTVMLRGGIAY